MTDVSFFNISNFYLFLLFLSCVFCIWVYVCECRCLWRWRHQFSGTGETVRCMPLDTGARSRFRFFGRAASPLNCWAFSLPPPPHAFNPNNKASKWSTPGQPFPQSQALTSFLRLLSIEWWMLPSRNMYLVSLNSAFSLWFKADFLGGPDWIASRTHLCLWRS